jgi:hypothetical protein
VGEDPPPISRSILAGEILGCIQYDEKKRGETHSRILRSWWWWWWWCCHWKPILDVRLKAIDESVKIIPVVVDRGPGAGWGGGAGGVVLRVFLVFLVEEQYRNFFVCRGRRGVNSY